MPDRDPPSRIPRITREERSEAVWELIEMFSGPGRLNVDEHYVLNTLGQHPELAKPFLTFNHYLLLSSTLPVRLRQIAIMRVCWVRKARYMWSSHLRTSLRNGLSGDEFEPVKLGADSPYWNEQERMIVKATDQLMATSDLDDATWEALEAFLDRRELMDFLFTVGAYVLLAMVLNSLRIEREDELLELAERYGSPV
jgi:4-carboxymuconolactone decarboxylase